MELTKKTLTVCVVITVFSGLLYFLFLTRVILLYLVVAVIFALAINPLVRRLKRLHITRIWAIIIAFIALLIVLFGVIDIILTPLVHQAINFAQNLPATIQSVQSNSLFITLNQKYDLMSSLNQLTTNTSRILLGSTTSLLFILSNAVSIISTTSILIVLTFLLLIEGEKLWLGSIGFLIQKKRLVAERIGTKIATAVSGFIAGNLFISLIAGIITYGMLLLLGVPYALPLAALVALFDLIPLVGAAIATVIVGLVALIKGVIIAIIAVGILLVYQFVEGHVIQPLVYSRSVNLSALLVILASIIGAKVYGVVGILLAIPVAAVIQILVTEAREYYNDTRTIT